MVLNRKLSRSSGITMIELLVALPMLALIGLAISYSVASTTRATEMHIARLKCQVAVGNLLTLIKAKSDVPAVETLAAHVQGGLLKASSVAHPDGALRLLVRADVLANDDGAHGTIRNVFRLRVSAPDHYGIQSEIKTYFGY